MTERGVPAGAGAGAAGGGDRRLLAARRLVTDTVDLCERMGRTEQAAALRREVRRAPRTRPVVVVAGETKRGKSSLVNALLEWPELSPTGPATVTGTFVVFSHGATPGATVTLDPTASVEADGDVPPAEPVPGPTKLEVDLDDLADWVSVSANPANTRRVGQVEVRVPAELLTSVRLVDTPGVGGLDTVHGVLALQAVAQADALVFVVDAGAPLSSPELDFLQEASRRIDTVIVVLTKTDTFRGWQRVLDDDRRLLAEHAPALARSPVVPFSARVAAAALAATDPATRARHLERSGLGALRSVLADRVVARRTSLALANSMQVVANCLDLVTADLGALAEAASGDPEVRDRLRREQDRLEDLERDSARWRSELGTGVEKIRNHFGDGLGSGLAELRRTFEARIAAARREDRERIPDEVLAALVTLTARLSDEAGSELEKLALVLVGEVDAGSALGGALARASGIAFDPTAHAVSRVERPGLTRVEKLSGLVSFSSGRAIGSLAATLPLVGTLGLPVMGVGLGVGVLFSMFMTRARQDANRQANLQRWLTDQVDEARRKVMTSFADQMADAQAELRDALTAYIREQRVRAAALRQAAERAAREDEAGRAGDPERRAAADRLSQVRSMRQAATSMLRLCGSVRVPDAPAGPP